MISNSLNHKPVRNERGSGRGRRRRRAQRGREERKREEERGCGRRLRACDTANHCRQRTSWDPRRDNEAAKGARGAAAPRTLLARWGPAAAAPRGGRKPLRASGKGSLPPWIRGFVWEDKANPHLSAATLPSVLHQLHNDTHSESGFFSSLEFLAK